MNLRQILLVLSLLAFLSAATGGYLYYSSLKEAAFKEIKRQTVSRSEIIGKNLSFFLSENIKPVRTLSGMKALKTALKQTDEVSILKANKILDHFQRTLDLEVCYLMDQKGTTIASSNRNAPDSFVGKNFNFRPYFQQAMDGIPSTYLALGTASGRRGAYYSHPIYIENETSPLGVVVIKASIELIEKELFADYEETVLVTDPLSVVFISNREDWLYNTLRKLSDVEKKRISDSLQFGMGPWKWAGLTIKSDNLAFDLSGNRYHVNKTQIDNYPGWHVIYLNSIETVSKRVSDPFIGTTGPIILTLCIFFGVGVYFLYQKASIAILKRQAAEIKLRENEERYRSLYHHTPAMLHSIDMKGRLLSVSDFWLDVLGYGKDEVIGKKLTRFYTEKSRRYAEEIVFPEFFKTGFCKDIPYQFIKKDGEVIDVLLSAISEQDANGSSIRSLAVSIDVTERKKAEEALKIAKEELSRYSKDLEQQVRMRTREITNILKYTPAGVYIKDEKGRFLLVNSRFEELFGVRNDEIKGKEDHDVFPQDIADQLRTNDQQVLLENRPCQIEEHIMQKDGEHTYLSVKFPIYDDSKNALGICGILTDITPLKKAQDQLRRLSGNIMANQEKERSAIARELHDELGQVLTALRMDSVWIYERLKKGDASAAGRALTMCELIDTTIQEVRGLAFRIRPGVLDDLGLVDALEWYTADFERRTDITCIFEYGKIASVSDTVATASYRIAQEALTNVARHSGANHVDVRLFEKDSHLVLKVQDDGKGFIVKELSETETLGLAVMHERANLVDGFLEIKASPGQGTSICLKVPVSLVSDG